MLKKKKPTQAEAYSQTGAGGPDTGSSGVTIQAGAYSETALAKDPRESLMPAQQGQRLLTGAEMNDEQAVAAAEPVPMSVLSDMEMLKDRNKVNAACATSWMDWLVCRRLRHSEKVTGRMR